MLWTPQKGVLRVQHNLGGVGSSTLGASVTTGAAAGTKGTPAELIASTSFDAYWVTIMASGYGAATITSQGALDILIGAATEEVLIPDLLMGFCGGSSVIASAGMPKVWNFPLYIPAGSRLAAQACGDRVSTAMFVAVYLYGGHGMPPFRVGGRVETYGITALPAGTDVAAGYSGAEGAWVEIAAATSRDHFAFVPSFHPTDGDTTFTATKHYFMDMGIGAATEEMMIGGESFIYRTTSDELAMGPYTSMPAFHDVPSGTRLVARVSCHSTTETGEPDCAIHAVS